MNNFKEKIANFIIGANQRLDNLSEQNRLRYLFAPAIIFYLFCAYLGDMYIGIFALGALLFVSFRFLGYTLEITKRAKSAIVSNAVAETFKNHEDIVLKNQKLIAQYPNLFKNDVPCPKCGHIHASHWNEDSYLSWNDADSNDSEDITCPNCGNTYTVVQEVIKSVRRYAKYNQ